MRKIFAVVVMTSLVVGFVEGIVWLTNWLTGCDSDTEREETGPELNLSGIEDSKPVAEVKGWTYDSRVDDMDSGISQWASLQSDNFINMDFPYQGNTYATVTVRKTQEYGTNVYVKLDRGQFGGNSFKGTNYVRIRVDDAQPVKYKYNEAADGTADIVFLKNAKGFIEKAKKAKRIKIEVPLYQEGNRVFDFSVDESLKW